MKTLQSLTKNSVLIAFTSILLLSCKDANKEGSETSPTDHSKMEHSNMNDDSERMGGEVTNSGNNSGDKQVNAKVGIILDNYLKIKDALVKDNQEQAAKAGGDLATALAGLETQEEDQEELKEIIEIAKEHAEHIFRSNIAHQREHFVMMSGDIKDLLAITGTDRKLYQAHCPMYNENKGAIWLSESSEIKNP